MNQLSDPASVLFQIMAEITEAMIAVSLSLNAKEEINTTSRGSEIRQASDFMDRAVIIYDYDSYVEAHLPEGRGYFVWSIRLALSLNTWKLIREMRRSGDDGEDVVSDFAERNFQSVFHLADELPQCLMEFVESAKMFSSLRAS